LFVAFFGCFELYCLLQKLAIDWQRSQKQFVSLVNLELDLMELFVARDEIKKKNALKRQVNKDRNDLFSAEAKEQLRKDVPARILLAHETGKVDGFVLFFQL
jgi:hypothetical protein